MYLFIGYEVIRLFVFSVLFLFPTLVLNFLTLVLNFLNSNKNPFIFFSLERAGVVCLRLPCLVCFLLFQLVSRVLLCMRVSPSSLSHSAALLVSLTRTKKQCAHALSLSSSLPLLSPLLLLSFSASLLFSFSRDRQSAQSHSSKVTSTRLCVR